MVSVPISMPVAVCNTVWSTPIDPCHAELFGQGDSTVLWVHYWTGSCYVLLITTYSCRPLRCKSAIFRGSLAPKLTGCASKPPSADFHLEKIYVFAWEECKPHSIKHFFHSLPDPLKWPLLKGTSTSMVPTYQHPGPSPVSAAPQPLAWLPKPRGVQ